MLDRSALIRSGLNRWWVLPLAIFAFSRLVESLLFGHLLALQAGHPSVSEGLANWDGVWYRRLVEHGYPQELPRVDGVVVQNVWAFYPIFPGLVRALMATGLDFNAAAILVSSVCGAIACCILFAIVRQHASRFTAAMAVVGLTFSPVALLLEATYTESLALMFVLACLAALGSQRYGWAAAFTVLLALTRAIALPLALVFVIHGVARWRSGEAFEFRERAKVASIAALAAASFGLWPLIATIATGDSKAYLETQAAWAATSRYGGGSWLVQLFQFQYPEIVLGAAFIIAAVAWLGLRRASRVWGLELRAWMVAYVSYIGIAVRPSLSIFRFLLLAVVPWWPAPDVSERVQSARARAAVVGVAMVVGLVLQYFWIRACFVQWPGQLGSA